MVAEKRNQIGKRRKAENVPDYLVYEELDGMKVYYQGYKNVLEGKQTPEEIMGYGYLQAILLTYIKDFLQPLLGEKMLIIQGETGLHLEKNSNPSLDLCIYPKEDVSLKKASNTYLNIPPKVIIEVDTKADVTEFERMRGNNYFLLKTQKLLDFGVTEILWVFTKDEKVMVARPNQPWLTVNWTDEIEVLGHRFSIQRMIDEAEKSQKRDSRQ